MKYTVMVSQ